jgi:protein transport protein SEC20
MTVWYETYVSHVEEGEREVDSQLKNVREMMTSQQQQVDGNEPKSVLKDIRERIVTLEQQLNEWERISFEECENEGERQIVLTLIRKHQDRIRNYHLDLKKTILDCKRYMEQHHMRERHELLSSGSIRDRSRIPMENEPSISRNSHSPSSSTSSLSRRIRRADPASKEITQTLEHVTHLMTNEVEKSEQLIKLLTESSHTNIKLRDEYRGFSGILHETRRLVRHLWQREMSDRCFILVALLVYLLVIVYIIKRRVFPGGTSSLKEHPPTPSSLIDTTMAL